MGILAGSLTKPADVFKPKPKRESPPAPMRGLPGFFDHYPYAPDAEPQRDAVPQPGKRKPLS